MLCYTHLVAVWRHAREKDERWIWSVKETISVCAEVKWMLFLTLRRLPSPRWWPAVVASFATSVASAVRTRRLCLTTWATSWRTAVWGWVITHTQTNTQFFRDAGQAGLKHSVCVAMSTYWSDFGQFVFLIVFLGLFYNHSHVFQLANASCGHKNEICHTYTAEDRNSKGSGKCCVTVHTP